LEQWQWIVQRLAAISEGVVIEPAALPALAPRSIPLARNDAAD